MSSRIKIEVEQLSFTAELNDSPSAAALLAALPLEVTMSRWGEEYYGGDLQGPEEPTARTEMEVGELAIWPAGGALCIFFGPTPASVADEPRAISNVNPIGRILEDVTDLRELGGSIQARFTLAG